MGRFTIKLLRKMTPDQRLLVSVYMFWGSIAGGTYSTVFISQGSFEKILMAISWGAITLTAVDVIVTSDVRAEQEGN